MRIVETARGASLRHGRHVVSEALRAPGPTHSVFDVLAAASVRWGVPGAPLAMLGFAAGGMVAPLRALGFTGVIEAVDLDPAGLAVFERVRGPWCGDVRVSITDAVAWLGAQDARFGAVVEDLSVQVPGDVHKPRVSLDVLPSLGLAKRVAGGVRVSNGLPCDGATWRDVVSALAGGEPAVVVTFKEFDNRIVIAGPALADAAAAGRTLRDALSELGSKQAGRITVRAVTKDTR